MRGETEMIKHPSLQCKANHGVLGCAARYLPVKNLLVGGRIDPTMLVWQC